MDIGCRFYTPTEISDAIASHAGIQDLVVDLFAGVGSLYKAFLRRDYALEAMAFDINPSVVQHDSCDGKVFHKLVDCLNPNAIKDELVDRSHRAMVFTLNPPFKRISVLQELSYWKQFDGYSPQNLTQRIECIAIAAAIQAAPKDSEFYVILPEIVLESNRASLFFEVLKSHYSLTLINKHKRTLFSSAEVDVAVIMLKKHQQECITKVLNRQSLSYPRNTKRQYENLPTDKEFKLFRGKVRTPTERKYQISVKHLKVGGTDIRGNRIASELQESQVDNFSTDGDILIARVGPRMIGRVGIVAGNCVITNESIVTLRVQNPNQRVVIYNALKSSSFIEWCNAVARGTANYFITNKDIKNWVSKIISSS